MEQTKIARAKRLKRVVRLLETLKLQDALVSEDAKKFAREWEAQNEEARKTSQTRTKTYEIPAVNENGNYRAVKTIEEMRSQWGI